MHKQSILGPLLDQAITRSGSGCGDEANALCLPCGAHLCALFSYDNPDLYHTSSPIIDLIGQQLYDTQKNNIGMHSFQCVFQVFHLFKKVKKPCLTVLRLQVTAETQKLLSNKMAKPPWVHGHWRGLDTRRVCNSSKGRRMHNAWTKEAPEHLQEAMCCSTTCSSLTTAKSGIACSFCSMHRALNRCQGEVILQCCDHMV